MAPPKKNGKAPEKRKKGPTKGKALAKKKTAEVDQKDQPSSGDEPPEPEQGGKAPDKRKKGPTKRKAPAKKKAAKADQKTQPSSDDESSDSEQEEEAPDERKKKPSNKKKPRKKVNFVSGESDNSSDDEEKKPGKSRRSTRRTNSKRKTTEHSRDGDDPSSDEASELEESSDDGEGGATLRSSLRRQNETLVAGLAKLGTFSNEFTPQTRVQLMGTDTQHNRAVSLVLYVDQVEKEMRRETRLDDADANTKLNILRRGLLEHSSGLNDHLQEAINNVVSIIERCQNSSQSWKAAKVQIHDFLGAKNIALSFKTAFTKLKPTKQQTSLAWHLVVSTTWEKFASCAGEDFASHQTYIDVYIGGLNDIRYDSKRSVRVREEATRVAITLSDEIPETKAGIAKAVNEAVARERLLHDRTDSATSGEQTQDPEAAMAVVPVPPTTPPPDDYSTEYYTCLLQETHHGGCYLCASPSHWARDCPDKTVKRPRFPLMPNQAEAHQERERDARWGPKPFRQYKDDSRSRDRRTRPESDNDSEGEWQRHKPRGRRWDSDSEDERHRRTSRYGRNGDDRRGSNRRLKREYTNYSDQDSDLRGSSRGHGHGSRESSEDERDRQRSTKRSRHTNDERRNDNRHDRDSTGDTEREHGNDSRPQTERDNRADKRCHFFTSKKGCNRNNCPFAHIEPKTTQRQRKNNNNKRARDDEGANNATAMKAMMETQAQAFADKAHQAMAAQVEANKTLLRQHTKNIRKEVIEANKADRSRQREKARKREQKGKKNE